MAPATLSAGFSQPNSGECTPTIVSPACAYRSCQPRTAGITFWQLIQPYVQNSTSTTRPRSPAIVRGSLLSQGPPVISGAAVPTRTDCPATPPASHASKATGSANATTAREILDIVVRFIAASPSNGLRRQRARSTGRRLSRACEFVRGRSGGAIESEPRPGEGGVDGARDVLETRRLHEARDGAARDPAGGVVLELSGQHDDRNVGIDPAELDQDRAGTPDRETEIEQHDIGRDPHEPVDRERAVVDDVDDEAGLGEDFTEQRGERRIRFGEEKPRTPIHASTVACAPESPDKVSARTGQSAPLAVVPPGGPTTERPRPRATSSRRSGRAPGAAARDRPRR